MATNLHISSMVLNLPYPQQPERSVLGARDSSHCCLAVASRISIQPMERGERATASKFQPNIWNYESLQLLKNDHSEGYRYEIKMLAEEVHEMLQNEDTDSLSMLELIDKIQRFGLGYRFEEDIRKALEIRLVALREVSKTGHDLHAVALSFRLLRQHGYTVSQDVFKKFMKHEGKFKAELEEDVRGMLSLYEASHLGLEGENLLEEAITFTRMNLEKKMCKPNDILKMGKGLAEEVRHSLETPLHHRAQRHEARWSMEQAYRHGDEYSTNCLMLLELAKLDFNTVQSTHQANLKEVSRWWEEMGLSSKLSFARDRLVESFFWAMGIACEPQQSKCRKGLTKVATLVTTIDDIYDVYGTVDELEVFTDAVKRWDVKMVDELPDYMKLCFLALYNTVNEMAYDILKQHGHNATPYLSKAWGDLCQTFLQEAKWNHKKETPRIDEYLENSWLSSSGALFLVHAYFFVSQDITKEALQCLEQYHDLLRLPSLLFRLYNDLSTSKAELERGESANSIVCYMNETGASEELARRRVKGLIETTWREMNISTVNVSPFSRKFTETTLHLARTAHLTYQHGDAYGAPDIASKNRVKSLIMDPITSSVIPR